MAPTEAPKTPELKLATFRATIQALKDREMEKKRAWEERGRTGDTHDPDFDYIEPGHLLAAEERAYEVCQQPNLERALVEFETLREEARNHIRHDDKSPEGQSRYHFWAVLGNMLNARQLEEFEREARPQ